MCLTASDLQKARNQTTMAETVLGPIYLNIYTNVELKGILFYAS